MTNSNMSPSQEIENTEESTISLPHISNHGPFSKSRSKGHLIMVGSPTDSHDRRFEQLKAVESNTTLGLAKNGSILQMINSNSRTTIV